MGLFKVVATKNRSVKRVPIKKSPATGKLIPENGNAAHLSGYSSKWITWVCTNLYTPPIHHLSSTTILHTTKRGSSSGKISKHSQTHIPVLMQPAPARYRQRCSFHAIYSYLQDSLLYVDSPSLPLTARKNGVTAEEWNDDAWAAVQRDDRLLNPAAKQVLSAWLVQMANSV